MSLCKKTSINSALSDLNFYTNQLRKSHDFRTVDLVPLRQINADLRSAKEVLARIHEIVSAKSSPFLIAINSASLL